MISSSRNRMVTVVAFLAPGLPICGPRGTGRQRHYNELIAELLRKDRGRVTKLEIAAETRTTRARTGAMIRPATRREGPSILPSAGGIQGSDASCPGALGSRPDPRLSRRRRGRLRYSFQALPQ